MSSVGISTPANANIRHVIVSSGFDEADDEIVRRFKAQGISLARRTVTKYREQLGVPVARLRKEIVLS